MQDAPSFYSMFSPSFSISAFRPRPSREHAVRLLPSAANSAILNGMHPKRAVPISIVPTQGQRLPNHALLKKCMSAGERVYVCISFPPTIFKSLKQMEKKITPFGLGCTNNLV